MISRRFLFRAGVASLATYAVWKWLQPRALDGFSGKVVLISGASRGLGLVLARQLAKQGARLMLTARNHDELQVALQDIKLVSDEVHIYAADFRDPNQIKAAVEKTKNLYGRIDVAIHNAGVMAVGPFETMTNADFEDEMKIHFEASHHLTRAVLPLMKEQGGGNIVNIASIGGLISVPHMLPYCSSKFALVGLSEGLNAELSQYNIRVTTVCPGLMRTGSVYQANYKGEAKKEKTWFTVFAALPFVSMHADRAAEQILNATLKGQSLLVLTMPAKLATVFHSLFPNLWSVANRLIAKGLPSSSSIEAYKGFELKEKLPNFVKSVHEVPAKANNELPH